MVLLSSKDFQRQGHKERALAMLHQMIEDAHMGKRQFLSGLFYLLDPLFLHLLFVVVSFAGWEIK